MRKKLERGDENGTDWQKSYDLFGRRWSHLIALSTMQLLAGYAFASFGPSMDFYASFFNVEFATMDWMTIAFTVGSILVTFPMTWMTFKRWLGLRTLTLIAVCLLTVGYLIFTVALAVGKYYVLIEIGQILSGLAAQIALATPAIFAAIWFPENQVGTAIGVNILGRYLGYLLGSVLPVTFLEMESAEGANFTADPAILKEDQFKLLSVFAGLFTVSAALLIFLFACLADEPPLPPTYAQMLKTRAKRNSTEANTFKTFFKTGRAMITNKTYVLCCIVFGLTFTTPTIDFAVTSRVLASWPNLVESPDVMSGYVVGLYALGCVVGCVFAGKVVDKVKHFHLLAIAASSVAFVTSVWIVVGFLCKNLVLFLISNVLYGAVGMLVLISLYEISMQQTYPVNEVFVGIWLAGIQSPIGHVISALGRVILDSLGGAAVLVFQSALIFVGFSLSCFFSHKNKRLAVGDLESSENKDDRKSSEVSSLIEDHE